MSTSPPLVLELLPHHKQELCVGSGLSEETLIHAGVYSETNATNIKRLLRWPKMPARMGSGIVFRFKTETGELNGYARFKPDNPRKDQDGKPIKYESPRDLPNRIYIPPGTFAALKDPTIQLLITEGEKKSLAADQAGFPCIGLTGVFAWKEKNHERLIPDLELIEWKGRPIKIVFDSDAVDNENVADAERRLAAQLINRGAIVQVVRLLTGSGGTKVGLDDFLVAHGTAALHQRLNAAEDPGSVDTGFAKSDAKSIDAMAECRRWLKATATHTENREDILRLRHWRGNFLWWTGTRYREVSSDDVRAKFVKFLDRSFYRLTKTTVSNVMMCLEAESNVDGHQEVPSWLDGRPNGNWLAMKNGILDISALLNGESEFLIPHTPRYFNANCLPFDFDATAECPLWLAFLDRNLEGDDERIMLLQEYFGYCLSAELTAHKFMFFEGEGANGKSVACAVLTALLGTENVSAVPLEQFGERFSLYSTVGKLANIASEVGEIDRVAEGILKAYTTGDAIQFDRKHRDPVTARPTAKLVFASNNRPRFSDKSGGLWRRMILMPWRIVIDETERVRGMDSAQWWRDQGELPGVLLWALTGLHRRQKQGGFTKSAVCEAAFAEYRAESNPARMFLDDQYEFDSESFVPCDGVYQSYHAWSKENGFIPLSANSFGHEIRRAFPEVHRKEKMDLGDRFRVYMGLKAR